MVRLFRCGPYFLKNDLRRSICENKSLFAVFLVTAFLGAAFGVYVGIKSERPSAPYGVFSCIFYGKYAPFSLIFKEFFRFFLYFCIAFVGGAVLSPVIFGAVGVFFFTKHWSEVATVVLRADAVFGAVLSLILVYIPLLTAGYFLTYLSVLFHRASASPFRGGVCAAKRVFPTLRYAIGTLAVYFLFLILIYFILCGVIRLFVVTI